ncbi:MAG: hypothetical protein Aurels2KO_54400 [Aureliella sp.]
MIMITAPTQVTVKPKGDAPVDSTALTQEVVPGGEIAPGEYAEDDAYRLAPSEPFAQPQQVQAGDSQDEMIASETAWRPDDAPLVPSDDWATASSARTKQYLLVGILGFSGVLVAIVGFMAFLNWYNSSADETPVAVAGGPAAVSDESVADDDTDLADSSTGEEPSEDNVAPTADTTEPAVDDIADATDPQEPIAMVPNDVDGAGDEVASPEELVGGLPPSLVEEPDTAEPGDVEPDDDAGLPEQLRAMEELLGGYDIPLTISDEGVVPSEAPLSAAELGLTASVGEDPLEPVDVAEKASKKLHALAMPKPPQLARFINLWTHLSGIPVVVDFSSLASAGLDRNAPPVFPKAVRDKTFGELLSGFASQNGMKMQVVENRFVRLHASDSSIVPAVIDVSDLVSEAEDESWLEGVLRAFYLPSAGANAETAIRVEGGQLSYDPAALDSSTWGEIARTIETWRKLQTGAASDFVKRPDQFLVKLLYDDRKLPQLEHVTTLVSPQSRPVGQVLSKLCEEAGLTCWIDWANVGKVGLGPQTTQVVVTRGRTLRRILADYARVYPLRVAILDDKSVWITSPQIYRSTVQVFVLPAEGKTALQWQSELRQLTPSYAADDTQSAANRSVLTELSPDAKYVFVRSCLPEVDLSR